MFHNHCLVRPRYRCYKRWEVFTRVSQKNSLSRSIIRLIQVPDDWDCVEGTGTCWFTAIPSVMRKLAVQVPKSRDSACGSLSRRLGWPDVQARWFALLTDLQGAIGTFARCIVRRKPKSWVGADEVNEKDRSTSYQTVTTLKLSAESVEGGSLPIEYGRVVPILEIIRSSPTLNVAGSIKNGRWIDT